MKLKLIKIVSCLFFICNIQAYVLNKSLKIFPKSRWTKNRNVNSLFLKINNTINFKNRGELKKEIIAHSKKMSLDLNDEQIKSIENKLNEFFSYMKWTNIRIVKKKKLIKERKNIRYISMHLCTHVLYKINNMKHQFHDVLF
ncbi:hypothetical protein Py17XNL_001002081 [Plasmodium yoelii yoelii]|uniref:Uncharacterized protein n=1 Tax=Plasmodium yoelii yoelii TaxID=73239 RepID=A0AAE9WSL1_PLAYO|nr:hypothetical protein Py17XNL_001002081 [Plasmodium yoelii yoelii]